MLRVTICNRFAEKRIHYSTAKHDAIGAKLSLMHVIHRGLGLLYV